MRIYKKHKCLDCENLCTMKALYCKLCGYKHKTRPSGLHYKIVVENRGWFKKGRVPTNSGVASPYFDKSIGYMKLSVKGRDRKYHRYLVEQFLGRKLDVNEIIHHKNFDKLDNRLENLEVISRGDHMRLHHGIKRLGFNLLFSQI